MQRALVEMVAALRRGGMGVSPAETRDALAALSAVDLGRREDVQAALEATLLRRERDRPIFDRTLQAFWERRPVEPDLFARLSHAGFSEPELAELRRLLKGLAGGPASALQSVIDGAPAVSQLLDQAFAALSRPLLEDPARSGFATMRALDAAGLPRARTQLSALRTPLADALGSRGLRLADALERELSGLHAQAAERLRQGRRPTALDDPQRCPFEQLSAEGLERMERLVRQLAARLMASERVRQRHARAGRLEGRATLRRALGTAGVPLRPVFKKRRPRKPSLWVLCDISDSVRGTARVSLTFLHAAQQVFGDMRSFVFVSALGETTQLFERRPVAEAIQRAYQGEVVSVADNSHYGRALRDFERLSKGRLGPRATLLIIGDARTNHFAPGDDVLGRLSRRVGRTLWLNPQPRSRWYDGDSALARYERHLSGVYPAHDYESFETAVRALVAACRRPGRRGTRC